MNSAKKLMQIFTLIFLAVFIVSCDHGCVEADQFDVESTTVSSYPLTDGIYGNYDDATGGQSATWHDTGLKSDGNQFIVYISGGWTPWNADSMTAAEYNALDECSYCARRSTDTDLTATNCICYSNQTPTAENDDSGVARTDVDCTSTSDYTDQNDPAKCSCTKDPTYYSASWDANNDGDSTNDGALNYGNYHITLNRYDKYGASLSADAQTTCKLKSGMGLTIGLFGSAGTTYPTRAYNMYTLESVCDLTINSDGQCLDDSGVDQTKYVFRSANGRIFMKDDNNGNDGTNTDTSDDIYHKANENVKLVINDTYYSDNYGDYTTEFYQGVSTYVNANSGLLEFMVGLVEDAILGEKSEQVVTTESNSVYTQNVRQGGIIEFMYNAIVQDSSVILIIQISLSLYIIFYGLATLFGVAEINKKELMNRALKIGLIIFFTSKSSWYFYNKIVVGFFKDSMDYVVMMMMDLSDSQIGESSTLILDSQMDRATDASNATRFAYVDVIIRKLLAESTTKKIFGLFFGEVFFGMLYIPMIYALIGYFIFVMLLVATIYLVNLMKIVFVLALGPIFICFTLFSHTSGMFKNWLGFLGARSLEIILLFSILYNFLVLIDKHFTSLFYYRTCLIDWTKGYLKWYVLKSYAHRSMIEWVTSILNIGGLIFITQLVINQTAAVAGRLIVIGGVVNRNADSGVNYGQSGINLANNMMRSALGLGKAIGGKALGVAGTAGSYGFVGAGKLAKATGVADKWNRLGDAIPFRSPRSLYRDSVIDGAIKKAQGEAKGKGLTGAKADEFVRGEAMKTLHRAMQKDPNKMTFAGLDMDNIAKRFDQKLVKEPLEKMIKEEAKKLKNLDPKNIKLGEEMREQLRKNVDERAKKEFSAYDKENVKGHLANLNNLVKEKSELGSKKASKLFANDEKLKNNYMAYLEGERQRKKEKHDKNKNTLSRTYNALSRTYHSLMGDKANNPIREQRDFKRNLEYHERENWKRARTGMHLASKVIDGTKLVDRTKGFFGHEFKGTDAMRRKAIIDYLGKDNGRVGKEEDARKKGFENSLRKMATEDLASSVNNIRFKFSIFNNIDVDSSSEALAFFKSERLKCIQKVEEDMKSDQLTPFEKAARLDYLKHNFGFENEDMMSQMLAKGIEEETKARAEKIAQELDAGKMTAEAAKKELEDLKTLPGEIFKTNGKLPDSFESDAEDALSKAKTNILPIPDKDEDKSAVAMQLSNAQFKQSIVSAKLQRAELDKRIKKFELAQLQQSKDPDKKKITELESEIDELDRDIKRSEDENRNLGDEINSYKT